MAEINPTSGIPQTTQNIDDAGLVELAERRKNEVEKKKKKFQKISNILKIAVAIIVVVGGTWFYFYMRMPKVTPINVENNNENNTNNNNSNTNNNENNNGDWGMYIGNEIRTNITYPKEAKVNFYDKPTPHAEVVYDPSSTNLSIINESNISSGYIFRVTPLNVGLRDTKSITEIKMQSYKLKCPATAQFSEVRDTNIGGVPAKTFDITNCDADYTISYLPRFQMYMEIFQMYKGDYGYRQKYKATTELLSSTLKFFAEDNGDPVGPFKTYINEGKKFLFLHPNLDENCCDTPAPPLNNLEKIVVLGDPKTYIDNNNFDGIGVYTMRSYGEFGDLNQLVQQQKKQLIEDYRVVKGADPVTSDSEIKVGKYRGIRLKGYSWRGNELIYTFLGNELDSYILVFSVKNVSGEEFDKKVEAILASLETF